jgi:arsenate reductase-like glutaredoxin family protein
MFVDNAIAMTGSDALPPRDGKFVYVYDNEPHNKEITSKILQKIDLGFPVVIWKRTDKFKDINEAIMKKIVDKKEVNDILKHRIKKGLNAKLEFALWRGK